MCDELGFSRKGPDQATSIRGGVLLGRTQPDRGLVNLGGSLVHGGDQQFNKPIALNVVIAVVRDLEGVVEEDVG